MADNQHLPWPEVEGRDQFLQAEVIVKMRLSHALARDSLYLEGELFVAPV
jgi:hypothetical protein